jgi:acetyl esterase/lipase
VNSIDYLHPEPPSFESKLIQAIMGLSGMKTRTGEKMIKDSFAKDPAKLPKSLWRNFDIRETEQNGRKVWTVSPNEYTSDIVILYLHGGAYMGNILRLHWDLVNQLVRKTGARIVVPDYPLAPGATYREAYGFVGELYARLTTDYPTKRMVFMGDSAGGGLAFGFAQQLRNENKRQPDQLIVFSPWFDVSMTNAKLRLIDKEDKLLSIEGLKSAGQKYSGDLDLKDNRVSPLYGSFSGLCRISVFTGTNDILNADAQKCRQLMTDQQISFNYFEYPKMFHDWVVITRLKESRDVVDKVCKLLAESSVSLET